MHSNESGIKFSRVNCADREMGRPSEIQIAYGAKYYTSATKPVSEFRRVLPQVQNTKTYSNTANVFQMCTKFIEQSTNGKVISSPSF